MVVIENGINPRASYKINLYDNLSNITRHDCGKVASMKDIKPTYTCTNFIFSAKLELVEFQQTKSGRPIFILKCPDTKREFAMFSSDMFDLIQSNIITDDGSFDGFWSFRKIGPTLGLVVEPDIGN